MCGNQEFEQPKIMEEKDFLEKEKTEYSENQPNLLLGQANPQHEQAPVDSMQLPVGVQRSQQIQEHFNVNANQDGILLGGVGQVPGEVDLEEKQKNITNSRRTDKSRKKHRENSAKLKARATNTEVRYNEINNQLKDNVARPLRNLKDLEERCLKSGVEGIRLQAEAERERIKASGDKDAAESYELMNSELTKNINLMQLYTQMMDRNSKAGVPLSRGPEKEWHRQQVSQYKEKIEECEQLIERQREALGHSKILDKVMGKVASEVENAKTEIEENKRGAFKHTGTPPNPINLLSYQDFAKMMGTHNRGQVAISDKKLTAINNGKFSSESKEESKDNLLIRQRFLEVVMDRMGGQDKMRENGTEEFFAITRNQLELNDDALTQAKPLSRRLIQEIISRTNEASSMVEKNLSSNKLNTVMGVRIAKNINGILGGNTDKEKAQNINSVLNAFKVYVGETPDLNEHQMNNLLKGNMSLLHDEIFASVNKISNQILNIGRVGEDKQTTRAFNVESFLADQEAMKILAAFHINKMAAGTEAGAKLEDLKLQNYIEDVVFSYAKPSESLRENSNNMNIESLASQGAEGLMEKLGKPKDDKEKGVFKEFGDLCETIRLANKLKTLAFEKGVESDEQRNALVNAATMLELHFGDLAQVAAFGELEPKLKNTRFWEGYAQAKELALDRKFSFVDAAANIASATRVAKGGNSKAEENNEANNSINLLSGKVKSIASVISGGSGASSFITKKKNDPFAQEMLKLHDFLGGFKGAGIVAKNIDIDGQDILFVQDSQKNLKLIAGKVGVPLTQNAAWIVEHLQSEILVNDKAFPQETIKGILKEMDNSPENSAEKVQSRGVCLRILEKKTGKPSTFFNNVSSETLLEYVNSFMVTNTSKKSNKEIEKIHQEIASGIITGVNQTLNASYVNGKEAAELIKQLEREKWREKDSIEKPKVAWEKGQSKEDAKKEQWTSDEQKVVTLIADMIFSTDSWTTDELKDEPGARMKKVLLENATALRLLIREPTIASSVLERMPLGNEQEASEMKKLVQEQLDGMLDNKIFKFLKKDDVKKDKVKANPSAWEAWMQKAADAVSASADKALEKTIVTMLSDQKDNDLFIGIEDKIDSLIMEQSNQIQQMINESLESVYEKKEEGQEQEVAAQEKVGEKKTSDGLKRMIEESAKGAGGQGGFLKNVFKTYFNSGSKMDKHAMFASALRHSVPKRKLPDTATAAEREQEQDRAKESFVGGFLKGTGPLMQKTLQGVPSGMMPTFIDNAIKDMKSNLAPIPQKYVEAQLNEMVNRSKGGITQIYVRKSLGAASVGQAFLCTMHGPKFGDKGKEVVVKLLRPDVSNRIEREKVVMIKAAEDVGEGMKATYLGQLTRIEEELDLTIEARNAQRGALYDNAEGTVKSMKLDGLVEPTANALVLEKAPGTTVDRYMDDVRAKREKIVSPYYQYKDDEKTSENLMRERDSKRAMLSEYEKSEPEVQASKDALLKMLNQLQERQEHLIQMSKSWVTEGMYGGGFYHGDLHAGNMMIDDKGLTLIDFGNATQLEEEQKKHILRMMSAAAAGTGFMDMFRNSFHKLLGGASEEKYQDKRDELGKAFENILQHGEASDAGLRICAALMKAQEFGVEVPSAIYNFSQSQMRLQNAIEEMNEIIVDMQKDIKQLMVMEQAVEDPTSFKGKTLTSIAGVNLNAGVNFGFKDDNDVSREQFSQKLKSKDESDLQGTLDDVSYRKIGEETQDKMYDYVVNKKAELLASQEKGENKDVTLVDYMKETIKDLQAPYVRLPSGKTLNFEAVCASNGDDKVFKEKLDELFNKYRNTITTAWTKDDFEKVKVEIKTAWSEFAKDEKEDEDKLRDFEQQYRNEQKKGGNPEKLNELEGNLYNQYDKMRETMKFNTRDRSKLHRACHDSNSMAQLGKDIEAWAAVEVSLTIDSKKTGVGRAYGEFKRALDSNDPTVIEKEKILFDALQSVYDRVNEEKARMRIASNKDFNERSPYSFTDVMGVVISENLTASLKRLGLTEGIRVGKAIKI